MATEKYPTKTPETPAGVIEKPKRAPKPTVTIDATQAKALAKALHGYADDLAAKGDNAAAIRYARIASGLAVAAKYGTKAGA